MVRTLMESFFGFFGQQRQGSLLQDVPLDIATELAEQVPDVFSVRGTTKKNKCRLKVNNIRDHEFFEAKVIPSPRCAIQAAGILPPVLPAS